MHLIFSNVLVDIVKKNHINLFFTVSKTFCTDSWFRWYLAGRLFGFSVYVSNTTDRSQGTLCFKDNNFTLNTIPYVFSTNCSVYGQYVIYYNERLPRVAYPDGYYSTVAIALCEVEVYGKRFFFIPITFENCFMCGNISTFFFKI